MEWDCPLKSKLNMFMRIFFRSKCSCLFLVFPTLHNSIFRLCKPGLPNSESRNLHSFQPHCPVLQLLHIKSPLSDQNTAHQEIWLCTGASILFQAEPAAILKSYTEFLTVTPYWWAFDCHTYVFLLIYHCQVRDHSKEYYYWYLNIWHNSLY